jgi:hypothetical protein
MGLLCVQEREIWTNYPLFSLLLKPANLFYQRRATQRDGAFLLIKPLFPQWKQRNSFVYNGDRCQTHLGVARKLIDLFVVFRKFWDPLSRPRWLPKFDRCDHLVAVYSAPHTGIVRLWKEWQVMSVFCGRNCEEQDKYWFLDPDSGQQTL